VAVVSNSAKKPESAKKEPSWRWQPVVLGVSNRTYFEVVQGLKPGEKVFAHPESLPAPRAVTSHQKVAVTDPRPQG
jgi:hypothetical protein